MNEQSPMLDRYSRDRLGQKLRSAYEQKPDPMLPLQLQELVARLLEGPTGSAKRHGDGAATKSAA